MSAAHITQAITLVSLLRVLLGLVLVVPAFDYFLPFVLEFPGPNIWHDPAVARLMDAFEASGLLAVAKCIQLVGGALLLFNRAVPFALAAVMCVHVCGAYIALIMEGSALLGLLAVLTLALNAVLMLAYLPAYFGVLATQSLADGEGWDDGANYNSVFANPISNARPLPLLGGLVVLLAAMAFYYHVVPFTNSDTGLVVLLVPALILLGHGIRLAASRANR